MSKPAKITFTKFDGRVANGDEPEAKILKGDKEVGAIIGSIDDIATCSYSREYRITSYRVELYDADFRTTHTETFRVCLRGKNPTTSRQALSDAKAWARANA